MSVNSVRVRLIQLYNLEFIQNYGVNIRSCDGTLVVCFAGTAGAGVSTDAQILCSFVAGVGDGAFNCFFFNKEAVDVALENLTVVSTNKVNVFTEIDVSGRMVVGTVNADVELHFAGVVGFDTEAAALHVGNGVHIAAGVFIVLQNNFEGYGLSHLFVEVLEFIELVVGFAVKYADVLAILFAESGSGSTESFQNGTGNCVNCGTVFLEFYGEDIRIGNFSSSDISLGVLVSAVESGYHGCIEYSGVNVGGSDGTLVVCFAGTAAVGVSTNAHVLCSFVAREGNGTDAGFFFLENTVDVALDGLTVISTYKVDVFTEVDVACGMVVRTVDGDIELHFAMLSCTAFER